VRSAARARPTQISMMLDPQHKDMAVEVVHGLLGRLPQGPTICLLRHYDGELARAVSARGFEPVATQLLMARDLPLKLRAKAALKPAQRALAGVIPVAQVQSLGDGGS